MDSYGQHMFTDAVKDLQDKVGTREKFEVFYKHRLRDGIGPDEATFITSRNSFYIASVGGAGWPYVQHRGGPAGFVKVRDAQTIGYADYPGNKQFITTGNLVTDDRVSLFFMDYTRKARLKLIGHATTIDASDDAALLAELSIEGQGTPERLTTIRVVALDWNCPQYITPRFDENEVAAMVGPHLAKRDRQIEIMRSRLLVLGEDPDALMENENSK